MVKSVKSATITVAEETASPAGLLDTFSVVSKKKSFGDNIGFV